MCLEVTFGNLIKICAEEKAAVEPSHNSANSREKPLRYCTKHGHYNCRKALLTLISEVNVGSKATTKFIETALFYS